VRQSELFNRKVRRRKAVMAVLAVVAALLFIYERASSTAVIEPQGRQKQTGRRRRPPAQAPTKPARDYSLFTHASHRKDSNGKELACSSCHTIPSPAEPDKIAAATDPRIDMGYPYHDSCLRCHRQQFYRGNFPVICTVCHTRVSPRLSSRDVYPQFPNPKRGSGIMEREFPGYFPHGLHQSLMVKNNPPVRETNERLSLLRVSFNVEQQEKQPANPPDVCATCHLTDERGPVALPLKGIQSEETFKRIEADTFKTIPGESGTSAHASCFSCHWQAQKPTKDDCNGCHLSQSDYKARKLEITQPPAFSPSATRWFKDWPVALPKRFSLKFRHNTHTLSFNDNTETNHHDVGCATCHINITQMTTLNIVKADVPIMSCVPCHATDRGGAIPVGKDVRVTIYDEMRLKEEPGKNYTCVACHISPIGREQPPCSHYSAIGQPCPKAGP
jgi:hypothetical protein